MEFESYLKIKCFIAVFIEEVVTQFQHLFSFCFSSLMIFAISYLLNFILCLNEFDFFIGNYYHLLKPKNYHFYLFGN